MPILWFLVYVCKLNFVACFDIFAHLSVCNFDKILESLLLRNRCRSDGDALEDFAFCVIVSHASVDSTSD